MRSCFADISQADPAPGERLLSKPYRQKIGHEPGSATVAVRERMYRDKTMVKPDGDFIRIVGLMLDPITGIVQGHAELDGNTGRFDTDITFGPAEIARPRPNVAEHLAMELVDKGLGEEVAAAVTVCPGSAGSNVGLLGFVEFLAIGNPGLQEAFALIRVQWRRVIVLV